MSSFGAARGRWLGVGVLALWAVAKGGWVFVGALIIAGDEGGSIVLVMVCGT